MLFKVSVMSDLQVHHLRITQGLRRQLRGLTHLGGFKHSHERGAAVPRAPMWESHGSHPQEA